MTTDKATLFLTYWNMLAPLNLPVPEPEYRFAPPRRWRFDWAFVGRKTAVEVEGNAWNVKGGGRHMQDSDMDKYNQASLLGWRLFRFSPAMLKSKPDECIQLVADALKDNDAEILARADAIRAGRF